MIPKSGILNLPEKSIIDCINAIEGKIASLRLQRLFKKAEELLDNLDPNISKHPAIQNERGRLYFDQKQYNKAINTFEQILKLSEVKLEWRYTEKAYEGLIASYRLKREFDKAKDTADKALKEVSNKKLHGDKNPAGIINQQGWIILDVTQKFLHEAQNIFDKAVKNYTTCLAEAKNKFFDEVATIILFDIRLAKARNKVDESLKPLISNIEKFLDGKAQNKFHKAAKNAFDNLINKLFNTEKFDKIVFYEARREFNRDATKPAFIEAYKKFGKAARLAKHWPQPKFNQIQVLNRLLNLEKNNEDNKMEKFIKKLEKYFPSDLEVKEQIGWVYFLQNKIQKSETMFREMLKKDKENIWGINGLSAVYLAQEKYKEAEKGFKKILDYGPECPIFLTNCALTLVRQGESNFNVAKNQCNKSLEQDAEHAPAFLCLAVIAFKQGHYSKSEYYLKKAIETGMRGSHTDLGALYAKMGRYDEAEEELEKAIRLNTNDLQAHLELNKLRFQITKNKKADKEREEVIKRARGLLEKVAKIDPNNGLPNQVYLSMLMESKQSNKVLEEAEKILCQTLQRLDDSKRWQLHLTLSCLLLERGEKINQPGRRWLYFLTSKLSKKIKTSQPYYPGYFINHHGVFIAC